MRGLLRLALFAPLMILSAAALAEFTASGGVQSAQLIIESDTDLIIPAYSESRSDQHTGLGLEAAIGYRYQLNPAYAIDLELFGQHVNAETDVPTIAGVNSFGISDGTASFSWLWGVRVRPGYQLTDDTRFFIDAGLTWGELDLDYSDLTLASTGLTGEDDEVLCGFRYGIGVEHALVDFLLVSVDYTITQFESATIHHIDVSPNDTGNGSTKYTPALHTLGLNLKVLFGGDWF